MRIDPPPLEAVTLDVWYTLLYQTPPARARYERARRRSWTAPLEVAGLEPAAADAAFDRLVERGRSIEGRGRSWTLSEQVQWMRSRSGVRVSLSQVTHGLDQAVATAETRLVPGALEALDELRSEGLRLALVSNVLSESAGSIHRLLHRSGIDRRVDAIVLSCELGAAKPSPRPIRAGLAALGTRAGAALHLGDQGSDIEAAWRAGGSALRFAGVERWWPPSHARRLDLPWSRAPRVPSWPKFVRDRPRWWGRARAASEWARSRGLPAASPARAPGLRRGRTARG